MSLAKTLLKARHMGIRDLRSHLSETMKKDQMVVVTEHGEPSKVLVSYEDMLEIIDILDELKDKDTLQAVSEAKEAVRSGAKGMPVSTLFRKVRSQISKKR